MGRKLEAGETLPDFSYQTPWRESDSFRRDTAGHPVCLMFLRYYGCSTCQLELHELACQYPRLCRMGVKLFAVLQSRPWTLRDSVPREQFPFDIICDPTQSLYRQLDIGDNPEPETMSQRLKQRVAQAKREGITHGLYEGNEVQAPATFLLDRKGVVRYVWYGKESSDVPYGSELVELIKSTFQLEERNDSMKNAISALNAPAAIGPYSQAVDTGLLVFVSGQLPIDPATGAMPAGVEAQTRQSLENIRAILEQAELSMEDVVKSTIFLQDLSDFPLVNEIYATALGNGVFPARACIQVARLPKDALVEIEVIAARK